jgi:hypothetical protein
MRKSNRKVYPAHVKIRNFLEDLDVDGRIILNSIFKKGIGSMWCGFVFQVGISGLFL